MRPGARRARTGTLTARTRAISLTPTGERMYERLVALAVGRNDAIRRPLGPPQQTGLMQLLDAVVLGTSGAHR